MNQMMITYKQDAAFVMTKEPLYVDIQKSEPEGGPTGIKEQERREESDALKDHFKPVAVIGVQERGFHLFVMNGMDRVPLRI